MAFDILFGPEDISIDSDNNKKIGQSFSFMVPSSGELKHIHGNILIDTISYINLLYQVVLIKMNLSNFSS